MGFQEISFSSWHSTTRFHLTNTDKQIIKYLHKICVHLHVSVTGHVIFCTKLTIIFHSGRYPVLYQFGWLKCFSWDPKGQN